MTHTPVAFRILVCLTLATLAAVQVLPFAWALATSLKPLEDAFRFPPRWTADEIRWSNYNDALITLPFARFLFNSVIISTAAVIGAVFTSSLAGYAFARLPWRGRDFWFALLIASMCFPSQVLLIPHFLTYDLLGWIDTYKPLIVPAWLGGGAFNVFVFRQYFRAIPRDIEESALTEGATRWQFYRHVLMPAAKPAVAAVATLSFIFHWHALLNPLIYLSDFRSFPVSLGLRMFQTTEGTWINLLCAAALVTLLPVLLVFFIGQRFFKSVYSD